MTRFPLGPPRVDKVDPFQPRASGLVSTAVPGHRETAPHRPPNCAADELLTRTDAFSTEHVENVGGSGSTHAARGFPTVPGGAAARREMAAPRHWSSTPPRESTPDWPCHVSRRSPSEPSRAGSTQPPPPFECDVLPTGRAGRASRSAACAAAHGKPHALPSLPR